MRLSRHHREHQVAFRLTPLIDVVFLLIIFFMTISQISRTNAQLIQVPRVAPAWNDDRPLVLTWTVDQDGRMIHGGTHLPLEAFPAFLQEQLAQVDNDPSRLHVLIRYDHRCPTRILNTLVRQLTAQGVISVRLAVTAE